MTRDGPHGGKMGGMRGRLKGLLPRRPLPFLIFALVLATAVLMGSALSALLTRAVTDWEWENTAALARQQVRLAGLEPLFSAPPEAAARARWEHELARLFTGLPEVTRIKVWSRDAMVLWSDEPRLIAQRFPDNASFKRALTGQVSVQIKDLRAAENRYERETFSTLAEIYVPILAPTGGPVVGVLEVYKRPQRLYATIARGQRVVWAISLIGGLALGLALLPLLRQVSRQEAANARRVEQEAYARRLEAEVAARTRQLEDAQTQLVQSQKMEAVGRLAGGVAHDFNNLLTIITGRSELLLRALPADHPRRRDMELILQTAERAATLTAQLLAFSRKQILQPQALDLNAVVLRIAPMLRRLIGEDVELVTELEPALGSVRADPGQVEQVVMNLAVNARDAMPRGGRLRIRTATVAEEEPGGRWARLEVADTGTGMSAETRARIFEPFFTTKGPGEGTGLGLSMVYGIVEQSGGRIAVASEVGRGTTFEILLPVTESIAPAEPPTAEAPAPTTRAETILLVEDEPEVREMTRELLEAEGYRVLSAGRPDEALERARRLEGPIHLLLTDVVMPQMNGRELAERLTHMRADLRVLFMSGYTDDAMVRLGVSDTRARFLGKPFTRAILAAKVREALERE
jgi:signal transduction histidine kinase